MRKRIAAVLLLGISAPALAQENGLKAWEKINAVFSRPRCANCDTPDDHPR